MAGSKESPRQKMINMMYLIFIAMLALNMSKEVLTAFGSMTEELSETNLELQERNDQFMQGLEEKAEEQAAKYLDLKLKADSIREISGKFYNYLESLKEGAYADAERSNIKRTAYEKLDKTVYFDQLFFDGAALKEEGQRFLDEMNSYRNEFSRIASSDPKLASIGEEVISKFSTDKVQPVQGKPLEYLDYHFKGFPLIASITKMTLLQSSIKNIEAQLLSTMLEGKLKIEASLTNFDAIVISDKSSFFAGEEFSGRIILGKNDKTLKADKVIINGRELDDESMQEGQTILKFPAGGIGSKKIEGEFQFREEGELISIPVSSSYEVVPRPNKATISADKMNVVYNGVSNPFTISFPGIDANKVTVNTPGLKKGKTIIEKGRKKKLTGASDYELDLSELPPQLRGKKQVLINVTGTLPSGQKVTSKIPFRIKSLPVPYGTLDRTKPRSVKKSELMSSTVTATFGEDFDFDLPLRVRGFKITVAGIGSRVVSGNELDGQAKGLVQRARNNTIVTITDIKTRAIGSTTEIKEATDVSFTLVN